MKKLVFLFAMLIASIMFTVSVNAVSVESIELPSTITVYVDETTSINPVFKPANATDKSYTIIGSDYTYTYKVFILGGLLGTRTETDTCKFNEYIQITKNNQLKGLQASVEPKNDKAFSFTVTVRANDGSGATARTLVKVLASRHKEVSFSRKRATCTTAGYEAGVKCEICGEILRGGETIPALGHEFSKSFTIDVEPTCKKTGLKSRHCLYCTATKDATVMDKTPHSYTAVVIEPTCTQEGYTVYTCVCSDNYKETIPAKGHSFNGSDCVDCGFSIAKDCLCKCHKNGIAGFFWKIKIFFQKLFKKNSVCSCGMAHY